MEHYKIIRTLGFRKDKMLSLMEDYSLDCIILTSPENIFYSTGYTCLPSSGNPILYTLRDLLPPIVHITYDGVVTLICWGFSAEGVLFDADTIVGINTLSESIHELIAILRSSRKKDLRIGIESTAPYYVYQEITENIPECTINTVDKLMAALRLVKSELEIQQIEKSTSIIEKTIPELYDVIHSGMSRLDLIYEARVRLMKNGATGISHATFSFGQDNPEIALDEKLSDGQLITLDLGAIYNGYCSDTRRYAFIGKAPKIVHQLYETMVHIVDEVGSVLTPGRKYAEVYETAMRAFERNGVAPLARMTHVGHNIGLKTEEQWLDKSDDEVQVGMVINIELYTPLEVGGQIGNEETFVIRENGPVRITTLPRSIRELV